MNKVKFILVTLLFTLSISSQSNSKTVPASFADLAEKLMPSVVNISTTQTVVTNTNPFPFQFPPGSPFEDMFKEFGTPQERKSSALGSGFIIDEKGIVVTNNHVIKGAEDIFVSVNGSKEYKATVVGKDPYMDLAVLQIISDEEFLPASEYIPMILNTWGDIKPKFHVSEQGSGKIGHHSDYIEILPEYLLEIPEKYGFEIDIMIEAKMKELSIQKLYEKYPQCNCQIK